MSCRRAYEVDLPAFLADASASCFDAFRDHYPRCAECSAEVRVWTELDLQLRRGAAAGGAEGHVPIDRLDRFERRPDALAARERAGVERHLARCAACRDELLALRRFAREGAPSPVGASVDARVRPDRAASVRARLRWLVWQPAFAYAVAAAVLLPTLYRTLGPEALLRDEIAMHEEAAALRPAPEAGSLAFEAPGPGARARSARERILPAPAAPEPPSPAAAEEVARVVAAGRRAGEGLPSPAPATRLEAGPAAAKRAPPPRPEQRLTALAARSEVLAAADAAAPRELPVLELGAEIAPVLRLSALEGPLRLRAPLPEPASAALPVALWVTGPDGERLLHDEQTLAPGSRWIETRVPRERLLPGAHRATVWPAGRAHGRAFDFEVVP